MPAKVTQRQLQEALVDVDYPADKQQLLRHAEQHGADDEVRSALRGLPPVDYENFAQVLSSVTTVEAAGEQSPSEKARRARERNRARVAEHLRDIDQGGSGG